MREWDLHHLRCNDECTFAHTISTQPPTLGGVDHWICTHVGGFVSSPMAELFTHHGVNDSADTLSTLHRDDNVWHSLVTLKIETCLVGQPQTQSNDLVQYLKNKCFALDQIFCRPTGSWGPSGLTMVMTHMIVRRCLRRCHRRRRRRRCLSSL